jgi:hypothetical protein
LNGFTDIPAEQTTAITDIILAIVSGSGVYWIFQAGIKIDRIKTAIWTCAFALLTLAAVLGSIAHGLQMSEEINRLVWHPLNLFLGLSVALFVVGVIYDIRDFQIPKRYVVMIIFSGLVFFGITFIYPGLFFVFILYEAIAMFFALSSYTYLLVKRKFPGSGLMFLGILISILAAVVQAVHSLSIHIIWVFDHNGLFHLIQIAGLIFLYFGLVKELKSRA